MTSCKPMGYHRILMNTTNTDSNIASTPQVLTKVELAKVLKTCNRTIDNWIRDRKIPFMKLGASVRFILPDVMKALSKYTVREVQK